MPKLKLTYFDIPGGRGEPARLAMHMAGIPFEDNRISFQQFRELRQTFPFGRVPVLEIDGVDVTHSNGINRYVGQLTNMYPTDPVQAACCDEAMGAVEDIVPQVTATFSIQDEAQKKEVRTQLADGPISFYLTRLEQLLQKRGGEYFADGRLTMADLKVMVWVKSLRTGNLDYVPTDLPERIAPLLVEHQERVRNEPKIRAYYEQP